MFLDGPHQKFYHLGMIEYVIPHNPDDRILRKAATLLQAGELICTPSDTNWILLGDPYVKGTTDKLEKIKHASKQKHFSVFCKDISSASDIAKIDNDAFKIFEKNVPGHFTFIFEATRKIAKTLEASKTDKEIGIRFVPSVLIEKLLETHGDILISTQVPLDLIGVETQDEMYSYLLEEKLRGIVKMIIDPGELEFTGESTIVNLTAPVPEITRQGAQELKL